MMPIVGNVMNIGYAITSIVGGLFGYARSAGCIPCLLYTSTKEGKALYLHCLPADINDVSCKDGEVEASVFDLSLIHI